MLESLAFYVKQNLSHKMHSEILSFLFFRVCFNSLAPRYLEIDLEKRSLLHADYLKMRLLLNIISYISLREASFL